MIYKAEKIGEKADLSLILTSALKDGNVKWFHIHYVCLLIK